MQSQQSTNAFIKETFIGLKTQLETVAKNHQASIQNLETKFDRLADKQSGRPSGSLPSNTQPNPKGHNSKAYQPPIDVIDEFLEEDFNALLDEGSTILHSIKGTLLEEKIFAEFDEFIESDIEDLSFEKITINTDYKIKTSPEKPPTDLELKPLPDNLKYLFLEELSFLPIIISSQLSKEKINKLISVLKKHKRVFAWKITNIPADLGASINLMPYSSYAKLSLESLKPTKMRVRLADRSFQYAVGIAKNMLVDFVIRVKQKQHNLGVGTKRMIFNIDSAMKHSYFNDDTCFSIDVIDEFLEEDFNALLDEGSKILHSIKGTLLEEKIFAEFDEFIKSDIEDLPFEKITINTDYKIKTSPEKPPTDLELKPLPDNLKYVFLEEPSFLPIIISSQLSKEKKNKLIS
nr:reverse transcriptase domain-containing protein [Tanacetum cinerariifolium]